MLFSFYLKFQVLSIIVAILFCVITNERNGGCFFLFLLLDLSNPFTKDIEEKVI